MPVSGVETKNETVAGFDAGTLRPSSRPWCRSWRRGRPVRSETHRQCLVPVRG